MQRYKALLEKTKTLFWNRWFTTNRRVDCAMMREDEVGSDVYGGIFTKDMGGCAPDPR